ncbi:cobalamin binding intrinsic factor-like [Stegodyphus dumicola]|uniref:cobalamin binding intrinsic factor-like n=1 Tax=Stegodyphus dumicola TaxID=202533 RepID=UPI0015AA0276|nr:cobalamin binding intrinsic factor-like [Stegodyphus dumicola]
MAKQVELKTSVAILRNGTDPVSPNQLSMFVNSLLTVCLNPRKFYGFDLVELLKNQLNNPSIIPVVYLALCNANETMPDDTTSKLRKVLSTHSDYPFLIDFQAMASMALSCMKNRKMGLDSEGNFSIMHNYHSTLKQFKSMQHQDGSFGNVYQTALVTQALLSGGQENSKDWNLNATIRYLMAQLNSSSVDFLTTYLTLPILNGKTLVDIAKINCSGNPRKHREDQVADIENKLGPKMRVQYSLYVGDEKDIIYTLSLRIPANITVYEIMEIAEAADDKYNFKSKRVAGKMYVYEIAELLTIPKMENSGYCIKVQSAIRLQQFITRRVLIDYLCKIKSI